VKKDQLVEVNKSMFFQILIDLLLLSFANNSISFDDLFETSAFSSFDDLLETSTFSFEAHNLRSTHDVLEFSLIVGLLSESRLKSVRFLVGESGVPGIIIKINH
jgi:hypothetical protein